MNAIMTICPGGVIRTSKSKKCSWKKVKLLKRKRCAMSNKMPCRITDEQVYNPWDHDDDEEDNAVEDEDIGEDD